ncbi:hypothetical protein EYF80_035180 [Liparis tanakae]|uniref:Uncharacterized protein n=1 Tax=Liparis tanakae TaxID=230148 RepID=A0A4Z2GLX7_9TELE|nr:hypothetical protein EYF80_035180 [Liparis tanakae]
MGSILRAYFFSLSVPQLCTMRSSMGSSAISPRFSPLNMPDSTSRKQMRITCSQMGSSDLATSTTRTRPSWSSIRYHVSSFSDVSRTHRANTLTTSLLRSCLIRRLTTPEVFWLVTAMEPFTSTSFVSSEHVLLMGAVSAPKILKRVSLPSVTWITPRSVVPAGVSLFSSRMPRIRGPPCDSATGPSARPPAKTQEKTSKTSIRDEPTDKIVPHPQTS